MFGSKFVNPNKPSLLEVVSFTEKKKTTIVSSYLSERGGGGGPIRYFVTHFVQAAFGPKN